MKFAFVTCVRLGLACMEEIYRVGGSLDLVITLQDEQARDKSGRVYLDSFCEQHGIELLKVRSINNQAAIDKIKECQIDWLFIIGWSQIAKPDVLRSPKRGVLGMHPTLLPEGRGRASIPWAILKGLPETGVTLFQLDEGVDTGPILAQERLPLAPDETATTLYERVTTAHQTLIGRIWPDLVADRLGLTTQDPSKATVWAGRTPDDGEILGSMSVQAVDRLVRATTHPYPGAFYKDNGKIIRIWRGTIGDSTQPPAQGSLRLCFEDGIFDAVDYQIE